MNSEKLFDTVVAHAKNSGFVYQGSEIYGGLANTWDFGPLGVELKENIKKAWWRRFISTSSKTSSGSARSPAASVSTVSRQTKPTN